MRQLLEDAVYNMICFIGIVLVTIAFGGTIFGIGYGIWWCFQPPETTFTLVVADWECLKTSSHTSTYYVKSGSVMVPMNSTETQCDVWGRR